MLLFAVRLTIRADRHIVVAIVDNEFTLKMLASERGKYILRPANQAYPIIRAVVLGGPGTRASFVTRSVPGLQFTDTFVNEGADPITVDGVRYLTFKVAHEREGIEGNTYHSVITSWRDPATGLVLKVVERQIAGQSYGPDTTWSATRVERLP